MTYTFLSARYANAEHNAAVVITKEAAAVALSERDRPDLWGALMAWQRSGNVIAKYEEPAPPTPSLEPWRFFAMLELSGKRADLEAFIDAMDEPAKTVAKSQYQHSKVYYRDNPLVLVAQQALSLTDDALDALWQQASNLSL